MAAHRSCDMGRWEAGLGKPSMGIEPASEFPAYHNLSSLEQADNGRGTKGRIRVVFKILSFSVISKVFFFRFTSALHL